MNTIIRMSAVVAFLVTIGGALAVPAYAGDCPGDVQAKPGDSKSQVSAPQTTGGARGMVPDVWHQLSNSAPPRTCGASLPLALSGA